MIVVKAPEDYIGLPRPWIFLAGSIEMGVAEDWQTRLAAKLTGPGTILNPRRNDWDSSWEQKADSPQFRQQVEWELDGLYRADIIAMYLQPGTQSPISLLEFGLFASSGKLVLCCPEGFWRKGNVDIVCERDSVKQVDTLAQLAEELPSFAYSVTGYRSPYE